MIGSQSREERGRALPTYISLPRKGENFPEALWVCCPHISLFRTVSHAHTAAPARDEWITLTMIDLHQSRFTPWDLGEDFIFSAHFAAAT